MSRIEAFDGMISSPGTVDSIAARAGAASPVSTSAMENGALSGSNPMVEGQVGLRVEIDHQRPDSPLHKTGAQGQGCCRLAHPAFLMTDRYDVRHWQILLPCRLRNEFLLVVARFGFRFCLTGLRGRR